MIKVNDMFPDKQTYYLSSYVLRDVEKKVIYFSPSGHGNKSDWFLARSGFSYL